MGCDAPLCNVLGQCIPIFSASMSICMRQAVVVVTLLVEPSSVSTFKRPPPPVVGALCLMKMNSSLGSPSYQLITEMEGSSIKLVCRMNVKKGDTVQWFRDGLKISKKPIKRYILKSKGRKLMLKNLTLADTGNYICKDPASKKRVKIFRLVVTGKNSLFLM